MVRAGSGEFVGKSEITKGRTRGRNKKGEI
jgi:hypothetical protein